jgi:hypothetical protein
MSNEGSERRGRRERNGKGMKCTETKVGKMETK